MGRKPKAKEDAFATISVRVTPAQRDYLISQSKRLCLPGVATLCRQILLRDAPEELKAA